MLALSFARYHKLVSQRTWLHIVEGLACEIVRMHHGFVGHHGSDDVDDKTLASTGCPEKARSQRLGKESARRHNVQTLTESLFEIGLGQTLIGLSLVIITTMGLKQMRDASKQRNDQLDQMEAQSNALVTGLTAQTAALEKLLERK